MEGCIFCKIVGGEIPSEKVYEDKKFLAFLDIAPINSGHTLIITKDHYETLFEVPDSALRDFLLIAKKIAAAVKKASKAQGINLGMNNYKAAGQLVPHAHLHIIPRFEGDGLRHWPGKLYKEGEMKKAAEIIKKALK